MAAKDCCNGLFWLILLVFVSWWIACLCFPFYVFIGILSACIPSLEKFADVFLKGVKFPALCSKNMVKMASYNSF